MPSEAMDGVANTSSPEGKGPRHRLSISKVSQDYRPPTPFLKGGSSSENDPSSPTKDRHPYMISPPSPIYIGKVNVKAEEIGLVLVIFLIWFGAISLFINRWGKIRMLEPYQPAYTAPAVPSTSATSTAVIPRPPGPCINIQSTSEMALHECTSSLHRSGPSFGSESLLDRRMSAENSGYNTPDNWTDVRMSRLPSSSYQMQNINQQRKVRSAVDLVSLVMQERLHTNSAKSFTNV